MAQPSVAREPSMEEILASIRRIIESNEPGPAGAFSGQLPPVYDEDEDSIELSPYGDAPSALDRRNEPVSPPAHVPPPANQAYGEARQSVEAGSAAMPEKTLSLADVAARVRAAADRNAATGPQGLASQPAAAPVRQPVAHAAHEAPAPVRLSELRAVQQAEAAARVVEVPVVEEPVLDAPVVHEQPAAKLPNWDHVELRGPFDVEEPAAPEAARHEDAVAEQQQAVAAEAPVENREPTDLSLNLISAEAGQQIARSFNELADVFNGVERRSIEEMAEEMLRPMLQDWLEDNLPTLVERLVREEIERVARGPRR